MPKGSMTGLGVKYGATLRKRYTRVYRQLKAKRTCPSCGSLKFKRIAVGIWGCRSCSHKIADAAFTAKV